jgi:transposase-like protein
MFDNDKTLGYCQLCMQNVEHTRKFSSRLMFLLDLLTLRFFKIFRIGPFYCFQCENKTLYLRPIEPEAPTFDIETSAAAFFDDRSGKLAPQDQAPLPESLESQPSEAESVGNFLRADYSLLMRERRSRNFSQKFRDATVMKILSGNSSMLDIRRELDVNEADLIHWMSDLVNRKSQRIEELVSRLESIQSRLPHELQPILDVVTNPQFAQPEGIVEGKVSDR